MLYCISMNSPESRGILEGAKSPLLPHRQLQAGIDSEQQENMDLALSGVRELRSLMLQGSDTWNLEEYKAYVLEYEKIGGYCKDKSHIKTYLSFA